MMGNRCATIVQLTPIPLIQRIPEYLNMFSHNYLLSGTEGDMQRTEIRQQKTAKRMEGSFFLRQRSTAETP